PAAPGLRPRERLGAVRGHGGGRDRADHLLHGGERGALWDVALGMARARERWLYAGVGAAYLALGLGFVRVVPIGEAPDEPAHLPYAAPLVRPGRLPPLDRVGRPSYESYQPPLDYGVAAAWVYATIGRPIDYPFQPTGTLRFTEPGSRAVVPRSDPLARQ